MTLLDTLRLYEADTRILKTEQYKLNTIREKNGISRRLLLSFLLTPISVYLLCNIFIKSYIETAASRFITINAAKEFLSILDNVTPMATIIIPLVVFLIMTINAVKRKSEQTKTEKLIQEVTSKMESYQTVPSAYHHFDAISAFINYIETMQASTLKECINLYHTNLRHEERISHLKAINEKLYDIETEVEETNYRMK